MKERNEMTNYERVLFEGNLKLMDEKKEVIRDLKILIEYIKGDKKLSNRVLEIMKYYSKVKDFKEGHHANN